MCNYYNHRVSWSLQLNFANMYARQKIRIHVRNKSRYNPETEEQGFLFVDIDHFAETTVGNVKEVQISNVYTYPYSFVPYLFRRCLVRTPQIHDGSVVLDRDGPFSLDQLRAYLLLDLSVTTDYIRPLLIKKSKKHSLSK